MNLEEFIALEKLQLKQERDRLWVEERPQSTPDTRVPMTISIHDVDTDICPAAKLLQSSNYRPMICKFSAQNVDKEPEYNELNENGTSGCNSHPANTTSSLATENNSSCTSPKHETATYMMYTKSLAERQADNTAEHKLVPVNFKLDLSGLEQNATDSLDSAKIATELPKATKDLVNQRQIVSARSCHKSQYNERQQRPLSENVKVTAATRKQKDDMEQWVTDKFYSYFPAYNNENQKRQNYLLERQRENQQNLLKHQMLHPPPPKKHAIAAAAAASTDVQNNQIQKEQNQEHNLNTTRSDTSSSTNNTNASNILDKTDIEIIVTNPNYVAPKYNTTNKPRPGTTRHRLLHDLEHVNLTNILTGDGIAERNMKNAELETARKRDYQRDLLQQIEEKRQAIEKLREKERKQEEALTRRLEAQLQAMKLEEQLEKERARAEKARKESERNRLKREQLLAKLDNDTKLLSAKQNISQLEESKTNMEEAGVKQTSAVDQTQTQNNNKVYKYFSNSARHEYRRDQPLPAEVELDFELSKIPKIERECFHLCEKICPLCDEPLKSYESCCLRCQRKLALKMKTSKVTAAAKKRAYNASSIETAEQSDDAIQNESIGDMPLNVEDFVNRRSTYALVCVKCEQLYSLCPTCLAKSDVCRACHHKRHVCMNCRRTLCTFCLEEIASGRDIERTHINELEDEFTTKQTAPSKADAFRVLELNYASQKESESVTASPKTPPKKHNNNYTKISNDLYKNVNNKNSSSSDDANNGNTVKQPPYSVNIARNSIFHPDYKAATKSILAVEQLPNLSDRQLSFHLDTTATDELSVLDRVRRETERRINRYIKHYGDIAQRSKSESRNRSTQTTPQSSGRRDIVLHDSNHNLSMPLLCEMPKMTRNETPNLLQQTSSNNRRRIDNLKCRWEVPAVQKFTISTNSPKVLTQVGGIRKQLQQEQLLSGEDY